MSTPTGLPKLDSDYRQLLDGLAYRLPTDALEDMREYNSVGEWTELVEMLCAVLIGGQIAISHEHRGKLASLLDTFGPQDERYYSRINHRASTIAALNVESR